MRQSRRIAILALLIAVFLGVPSIGQTIIAGATPGGAFYTIAAPPQWNGGLVIWNHGFSLTPGAPGPDLGPLVQVQLAEGYAVAASSYRQVGWAVFNTVADLEELYDVFVANFGQPTHTLLYGASLGGVVTIQAVEQANLGNIVGAMPFCGALAGSRNWDAGLDVRLIYDALCNSVPGAKIPGAAKGLPAGSTLTPVDTVTAINACFGHDLPTSVRTPAQQNRLNRFLALTGLPQNFINTSLGFFAIFGMADLVHDPAKLGGRIGVGNKNVDYGDAQINAKIQRVAPQTSKRNLLRRNYTPTGDVGNIKIVSLHTDKDGLILVENESEYASMAPPDLFTVGIVQEAVPTHCGFSTTELLAGWETLRGWVAGDPQPSPLTLQVMCLALQPTFGESCRFNPFFQIPDMDGRVRPRNPGNKVRGKANASVAPAGPASPTASPAVAPPATDRPAAPGGAAPALPGRAPAPRVQSSPARSPRLTGETPEVAEPEARLSKRLGREER